MSGIIQGLIASLGGAVKDAYFNLTTLLLNTSSTNGAQNNTFLDSSTNNFTITRNGNTTQGTFTPFSQTGWSYYGPGSSQLSTVANPNLAFGTGAITFECWINTTSTNNMGMWGTTNESAWTANSYAFNYSNGDIVLWNNSALWSIAVGTLHDGNWHHIAIVRSGTTWQVFADGVSKGTTTTEGSRDLGNNAWRVAIGQIEPSAGDTKFFIGYLSNMRVSNTAIYTSNFTPSTTPLTTTSQGVSSSNVKFLSLQSNRFIENSTNAIALTIFGTPSVQAFSPFLPTAAYDTAVVGGSGYFDGSGDYLTAPNNAAFNFGSNNFTIECWFYQTSSSSSGSFISQWQSANDANSSWQLMASDGATSTPAFTFNVTTPVGITSSSTYSLNCWNHIAAVRNGSTVTLYLNGTSVGSSSISGSIRSVTNPVGIATRGGSAGNLNFTNGYIFGARVVNGTAVYTANFTPPTAPPTAITNTSLLLSATNAGIFDSTAKNVLETVGNAQVSTTQAKWGTTSIAFDGTGDNLVIPSNPNVWLGSGAFSIEMWLYPNNASSEQMLLCGNDTGSLFLGMNIDGANRIALGRKAVALDNFVSYTYSTGAWIYLAVTRDSSNNVKFFVNGSQVGSTGTNSNSFTNSVMNIGFEPTQKYLNGYIDDLRITKGFARTITASPTAAFPLQ
jgi:hypothetical protein